MLLRGLAALLSLAGAIAAYGQLADTRCAQTIMSVGERGGLARIELARSGETDQITTGYAAVPASADEVLAPGTYSATFGLGETKKDVFVPIHDNSYYYSPQVVSVTCGGSGPGTSDSTSVINVNVVDDEAVPYANVPSSVKVTETNDSQPLTIPVTFSPPFRYSSQVSVQLVYGTATEEDVVLTQGYEGDGSGGVIKLTVLGDEEPEDDETASIHVFGSRAAVIGLTIIDDDRYPFPYAFDEESYSFREDQPIAVTVQRNGSLVGSVELTLEIRFQPGLPLYAIPFVLAPGEDAKVIDLPSFDDAVYTGDRQATLSLSLAGWHGAHATLAIHDNEPKPPKPVLSIGDGSVAEGGPGSRTRLEIPVTLSEPLPTAISVNVTAAHGTTNWDDVVLQTPQVVQIPAGARTGIVAYDVIGDLETEPDETFEVSLATCCEDLVTMGRTTGTGTILNDDGVPIESAYRLPFVNTRFPDSERWLTVPVQRVGRADLPARVTLVLTSSDARVFAPRKIRFEPNETEKEARFYIYDNFYSGNANVRVELFDGIRLVQRATVLIVETSFPKILLKGGSAREGVDATAPITVEIQARSFYPISFHLHAISYTAKIPYDLPPYDEDITIPPLTSSYTINVPINDDREPEAPEQIRIDLTNLQGAGMWLSLGEYAYPIILDNDVAYVSGTWSAPVGTVIPFTVEFPTPAPSQDTVDVYLAPEILDGPPSVVVPKGATNVTFEATVRHAGTAWVRVSPPRYLNEGMISNLFTAQAAAKDWTLDPATLQVAPGETAEIVLPFALDQFGGNRLIAADPRIADVGSIGTGTRLAAVAYGVFPGQTEIRITHDGTTRTLSVVVADPPDPDSRKRSVRH